MNNSNSEDITVVVGPDNPVETTRTVKPAPQPLWLPEGSVRALIALIMTIALLVFVGMGISIPEFLVVSYGALVVYYFESRKQVAERRERMNGTYNEVNGTVTNTLTVKPKGQ